jgi:hypothetical protein
MREKLNWLNLTMEESLVSNVTRLFITPAMENGITKMLIKFLRHQPAKFAKKVSKIQNT